MSISPVSAAPLQDLATGALLKLIAQIRVKLFELTPQVAPYCLQEPLVVGESVKSACHLFPDLLGCLCQVNYLVVLLFTPRGLQHAHEFLSGRAATLAFANDRRVSNFVAYYTLQSFRDAALTFKTASRRREAVSVLNNYACLE